jgi:hypothetical protein
MYPIVARGIRSLRWAEIFSAYKSKKPILLIIFRLYLDERRITKQEMKKSNVDVGVFFFLFPHITYGYQLLL